MSAPLRTYLESNEKTLRIDYDQPLDIDSIPALNTLTVFSTATGALTVDSCIVFGQSVYVGTAERHTGLISAGCSSTAIKNLAGESAATFVGQQAVQTNGVAEPLPDPVGGTIKGTAANLYFDETIDPASVPAASAFAFSVNGLAVAASGTVVIYGNRVTVTAATAANAGDFVGLTYAPPGSGKLRDRDLVQNNVKAIAAPILLTNLTTTVVGRYATLEDVEDWYGIDNVAQWSQLDNNLATADFIRVARALAYADRQIDRELKTGGYIAPIASSSADFKLLTDIAAEMAGAWLYFARGLRDTSEAMDGKMEAHRKHAEDELQDLIADGIDGVLLAGTDAVGGGIQTVAPAADTLCGGLYPYPNYPAVGGFL